MARLFSSSSAVSSSPRCASKTSLTRSNSAVHSGIMSPGAPAVPLALKFAADDQTPEEILWLARVIIEHEETDGGLVAVDASGPGSGVRVRLRQRDGVGGNELVLSVQQGRRQLDDIEDVGRCNGAKADRVGVVRTMSNRFARTGWAQ